MIDAEFNLDFSRPERLGLDEAIFCAGKRGEQIEAILCAAEAETRSLLLTRLSAEQLRELKPAQRGRIDYDPVSRTGFYAWKTVGAKNSEVVVVSAGSSDMPVATEAVRTLTYYQHTAETIFDVGVAGLWRLLRHVERLSRFRVVIVVAGMDGALPSVVAGLVPGLVIAVPTSVGYGAADHGRAALHAALASCAPGLVVCNIDNGYGAACAALRALNAPIVGTETRS
ncbi:MAG: nickel pincer cofactor biosynthesis protein LarB [Pseudomonadota bacterium]